MPEVWRASWYFLTSASRRKKSYKKKINPAHTVRCWLIFFNTNMLNLPSPYLQNVNTCFSITELSRLLLGITLRFLLVKSRLSILFVKYSFKCRKCPTIHKRWYGNSVLVFGKSYFNPKCRCCSGFMVSSSERWRKLRVNVICNYHQGWSNKYGWRRWARKCHCMLHMLPWNRCMFSLICLTLDNYVTYDEVYQILKSLKMHFWKKT